MYDAYCVTIYMKVHVYHATHQLLMVTLCTLWLLRVDGSDENRRLCTCCYMNYTHRALIFYLPHEISDRLVYAMWD